MKMADFWEQQYIIFGGKPETINRIKNELTGEAYVKAMHKECEHQEYLFKFDWDRWFFDTRPKPLCAENWYDQNEELEP